MDKEQLKKHIEDYFNNPDNYKKDGVKLPYITLIEYSKLLSELGCSTLNKDGFINLMHDGNDYDTNGWQVDFWWDFKRNEEKYCLSGSLFYGDFKLSKNDDKD